MNLTTTHAKTRSSVWLTWINIAVFLAALGYGITFPLIAIRIENTGVTGALIGVNAAMPALGWIAGALLIPHLQIRHSISVKTLALGFLLIAMGGLACLRFADSYQTMTALRLAFGGGMGLFLRCIEYWITGISTNERRGRSLGVYSVVYMVAIMFGAAVQPALGTEGWAGFGPPLALLGLSLVVLIAARRLPTPEMDFAMPPSSLRLMAALPLAFVGVLAYGLYESIPTTLIQVYALRHGVGEATAAWTLSAAALGNLVLQFPLLALSDRAGRVVMFAFCSVTVIVSSLLIPMTLQDERMLLGLIAVWAGAAGTIYSLALAMVGDHFTGARLVIANAAFGILYATGSLVGPLVNGATLDMLDTHGIVVASAAIFASLLVFVGWYSLSARLRSAP